MRDTRKKKIVDVAPPRPELLADAQVAYDLRMEMWEEMDEMLKDEE